MGSKLIEVVESFNSTVRKMVLMIVKATKGTSFEARAEADKDLVFMVLSTDPTLVIEAAGPKLYESASIICSPTITSLDVLGVENKYQEDAKGSRTGRVLQLTKDAWPLLTDEDKNEALRHVRDLLEIYLSYLEL